MISAYHAKYYAHELTRRHAADGVDRLSQSLFDASVDLNPHQIEAALFALRNPLQEGVLLADEVGLGKTIEAALVVCQYWAERRRRLLVICPASLRKQWAQELHDKFAVPATVVDAVSLRKQSVAGCVNPRKSGGVIWRRDVPRSTWRSGVTRSPTAMPQRVSLGASRVRCARLPPALDTATRPRIVTVAATFLRKSTTVDRPHHRGCKSPDFGARGLTLGAQVMVGCTGGKKDEASAQRAIRPSGIDGTMTPACAKTPAP